MKLKLILIPVIGTVGTPWEKPTEIVKKRNGIVLNGIFYDLTRLGDGDEIPNMFEATGDYYFGKQCSREGDIITIQIMLTVGNKASYEARFPEPIIVVDDGPIPLPITDWPSQEEPEIPPEDVPSYKEPDEPTEVVQEEPEQEPEDETGQN